MLDLIVFIPHFYDTHISHIFVIHNKVFFVMVL